jgi:hypothetical protein
MPAVERNDFDIRGDRVKTAHVHAIAVRIGARNIKGLNAAISAKPVLCDSGVELIFDEKLGTPLQSKPILRNDQVKKSALGADRAVALNRFDFSGCQNGKPHPAAMTATVIFDQDLILRSHGRT